MPINCDPRRSAGKFLRIFLHRTNNYIHIKLQTLSIPWQSSRAASLSVSHSLLGCRNVPTSSGELTYSYCCRQSANENSVPVRPPWVVGEPTKDSHKFLLLTTTVSHSHLRYRQHYHAPHCIKFISQQNQRTSRWVSIIGRDRSVCDFTSSWNWNAELWINVLNGALTTI